jgi:uncharacterized membrane protein YkoI
MNANLKTLRLSVLIACGSITFCNAEKVQFEQLPRPLQDAIRSHTGSAPIEDIDLQMQNGTAVYEVGFKKEDKQTEMRFGPNGNVLNGDGTALLDSRKISFKELPAAVQQIIRSRAGRASIEDVDRIVQDGKATYEVSFKQAGKQQELLVSGDGRILRDIRPTAAGAPATAASPSAPGGPVNLQPGKIEVSGGKKIPMSEAPTAVQRALLDRAAGAPIEDLELGVWNSQPVYQAGFKSGGEHVEVQIADDGRIIHDPRLAAAAGVPAGAAVGGGSSKYSNVIQPVAVSGGHKIELREAPLRVQTTLRDQLGAAIVEDLELGSWQGRTVYEAGFKWNGQHVELQLDEDGNVIYDARTQLNK